jgi:hypothetical protein
MDTWTPGTSAAEVQRDLDELRMRGDDAIRRTLASADAYRAAWRAAGPLPEARRRELAGQPRPPYDPFRHAPKSVRKAGRRRMRRAAALSKSHPGADPEYLAFVASIASSRMHPCSAGALAVLESL